MVRIGPWPSVSLTDARKAARAYAGAVARGDDPAADKQEERRRASSTLRTLLAEGGEYERHLKRRHIVNTKTIMSTLRRGLGRLMGKDVAAITREDFVTAIVAIEDQGKPGAAHASARFSGPSGLIRCGVAAASSTTENTRTNRRAGWRRLCLPRWRGRAARRRGRSPW